MGFPSPRWQKFPTFHTAKEPRKPQRVGVERLRREGARYRRHRGFLRWKRHPQRPSGLHSRLRLFVPAQPQWSEVGLLQDDSVATIVRAEYTAALAALHRATAVDPNRCRPLVIFTDSEVLIKTMEIYIHKWRLNGWLTANGTAVKNRDILEQLLSEATARQLIFRHVKAHTGRQEWELVWNNKADCEARGLARDADINNRIMPYYE